MACSSQAFVSRICPTGEDTGDTLGSICAIQDGSLIDPFIVCVAPPPFGEAARLPITPPPVSNWSDDTCVVLSGTFLERPGPCTQSCPFYFATDVYQLYFDACVIWIPINAATPQCIVSEHPIAQRPAPCAEPCVFFYATDEETLYFSDCQNNQWITISSNDCILEDTIANRPSSCSQPCKFFYATDEEVMYFDDCTNSIWVPINGGTYDPDTAAELGTCDNSADMDEEPDAPTDCVELAWDVNEQTSGEDGIIINMITRIIYQIEDDGGSEILYGYCRQFGFDTTGRLAAISEECGRTIIDTPEDCV